ncbi:hypothetical protein [Novosphingobium guangzhouense]|uniref:Uncharacterized protein n=1 Tax=Novosphingobium guangzhouense TaxID=1850347 RepID=A0A2K2G430_9SPHN|nr:hypothetical protein [Novosphingobium guangzhouense]PNU05805.1 hypothetical protein A8V01_14665 [Novosphingobium guangzhouense]
MAEVAAVAGNVIKGVGGFVASRQQSKALKRQAREEENAGAAQSLRIRDQARKAIGQQLAAQSSNGFMGGTGSALDALTESQVNGALDAMTVIRDAGTKAQALRYEAKMRRTEGNFALASGLVGAASSVSGMKDDWAQARQGQSSGAGA